MVIDYRDKYGNALVALEKADEVYCEDIALSSTPVQLPDREAMEVIIQIEGGDAFIGNATLQNIKIPDGGTFILDVSNSKYLYIKGSGTAHLMILT